VEALFSKAYGTSMKPLFHLFLYTPDKLEIRVRQTGMDRYMISLVNIDMLLPVDIQTDAGIQRMSIQKKEVQVTSKTPVMIDPKVFYLKKVVYD
jgi:hypothetical protein